MRRAFQVQVLQPRQLPDNPVPTLDKSRYPPQRFCGFFVLFCWCISIPATQPDVTGGWRNAPKLKCPMKVLPHPGTGQAKFVSVPLRFSLVSAGLVALYNLDIHGGAVLTQRDLPTIVASC